MQDDRRFAFALLAPAILCVAGLIGWPMWTIIRLSFAEGKGMTAFMGGIRAWGLGNYRDILSDPETWASVLTTLIYVGGTVLPAFVIGLALALLLNERFPGRRALRCLALLPWAAPGILASVIFLWMFDPSYGVVNYMLRAAHLSQRDTAWFTDEDTALFAVIVPSIWKSFPFFTLTILGALQAIPLDYYEAASLDGASRPQRFRYVTWPAIRNPAILAMVLSSLWALREFDIVFATTGGGPYRSTETLGIRVYVEAFSNFEMGRACALGVLTLAIAMSIVMAARRPLAKEFF